MGVGRWRSRRQDPGESWVGNPAGQDAGRGNPGGGGWRGGDGTRAGGMRRRRGQRPGARTFGARAVGTGARKAGPQGKRGLRPCPGEGGHCRGRGQGRGGKSRRAPRRPPRPFGEGREQGEE